MLQAQSICESLRRGLELQSVRIAPVMRPNRQAVVGEHNHRIALDSSQCITETLLPEIEKPRMEVPATDELPGESARERLVRLIDQLVVRV